MSPSSTTFSFPFFFWFFFTFYFVCKIFNDLLLFYNLKQWNSCGIQSRGRSYGISNFNQKSVGGKKYPPSCWQRFVYELSGSAAKIPVQGTAYVFVKLDKISLKKIFSNAVKQNACENQTNVSSKNLKLLALFCTFQYHC